MLFYFIRMLILILIILLFILFSKKFKWKFGRVKIFIVVIAFAAIYAIMVLLPLESSFLKFDTVEQAFEYSGGGETIQNKFEENDCAFIISGRSKNSTSLHTLTKYGQDWGMLDIASTAKPFFPSENTTSEKAVFSASCITNNEKNKTLIIVRVLYSEISDFKIFNENGDEFSVLTQQKENDISSREYYIIQNTTIPNEFQVCIKYSERNEKIVFKHSY